MSVNASMSLSVSVIERAPAHPGTHRHIQARTGIHGPLRGPEEPGQLRGRAAGALQGLEEGNKMQPEREIPLRDTGERYRREISMRVADER